MTKGEFIEEIIRADEMASRCFCAAGEDADIAKVRRLLELGRAAALRGLVLRGKFNELSSACRLPSHIIKKQTQAQK